MKKIFITLLLALNFVSFANAKDSVVLGLRLEPPHLDPTENAAAAIDEVVYGNIFEGLFQIKQDGSVKKLLATDYKISNSGKTYTISIKDNVYFHNGNKLTADDVVFSLNRINAEGSKNPRKAVFGNIKSVSAKGKYKVVIELKNQSGGLIYNLALPEAVIFDKSDYKNNKTNPVGTGAFKFVKMKKGYFVELNRNEKYHGQQAKLKTVKFRFIADALSASASMLSGEVDGFPVYNDVMTLNGFKNTKFDVVMGSTEGEVLVAINNKNKYLKNKKVRQALNHAIDKKALIEVVSPGATAIGSHYPPHGKAYVDLSNKYPYDVNKAKALLKQAGAENMTIDFMVPPPYKMSADVVAGYLRKAGIGVKIKIVDWGTWLSSVFKKGQYGISIIAHVETNDYDIYANPNYYFGYDNKKYQNLITKIKRETNEAKRIKLLKQAQNILADDAVNVWLYQMTKIGVWNKNLKGLWKNAPVEGNILKDVYWNE
ncbi:MAG: ABC transporter substrate-binding protein [Alphaproteobacteria bacterium]